MKTARLARIIEYLSEYMDKHGFFQRACNLSKDKGGYLWIGVYFVFNNEIRRAAFSGDDDKIPSFEIGRGNVGFCVKHGAVRNVTDIKLDKQFIPRLPQARSELVVPIIESGVVRGAIDCFSERANYFSDEDVEFLKKLAEMCLFASKQTLTL
ncbi:MAG: GAF domain-containing protein [Candidatus Aenigmarchaeota archaeon]|nr:GAF domain-containing protein [Candidatus Aenigmarchaeota archaeon]